MGNNASSEVRPRPPSPPPRLPSRHGSRRHKHPRNARPDQVYTISDSVRDYFKSLYAAGNYLPVERPKEREIDDEPVEAMIRWANRFIIYYNGICEQLHAKGVEVNRVRGEVNHIKAFEIPRRLKEQETEHTKELSTLIAGHDKMVRELKDKYDKDTGDLHSHYSREMHNESEKHKAQVQSLTAQLQQLQTTLSNQAERHRKQTRELEDQHAAMVQSIQDSHDDELKRVNRELARARQETEDRLEQQRAEFGRHAQAQEDAIYKLKTEIMAKPETSSGWSDDRLKFFYTDMKRAVEKLTTLPGSLDPGYWPDADVDPTGFVQRFGAKRAHFLFRNLIWSVLMEQFFSTPFGFGVFGDEGRREVVDLVGRWAETAHGRMSDDQISTLFTTSPESNKWRSATFLSLRQALLAGSSYTPLARSSDENVQTATSRILGILRSFPAAASRAQDDAVANLVRDAFQLGLQFGTHPAKLQLYFPSPGERITVGPHVQDCVNGDQYGGRSYDVQLAVLPGLQMVGNGRNEWSSRRTVVACEVFVG